ncbi:MAG: triose-phosphate isomerase [Gammaproteobacteria bacterium]|nr:triose-phosphate isomerase [Gammaproteobacteria bacterium]
MRRPMVAGNWKMNGTRSDAGSLLDGVVGGLDASLTCEVVVCPPSILIPVVAEKLAGTSVSWGGQNLDTHDGGAYTGEISGGMLKDFGSTYVIVGHSERRSIYGESDDLVAEKFQQAQKTGLIPILCVGELLEERERGQTESVVGRQLDAVLAVVGIAGLKDTVIAYEPVWAIGTGKTASADQAQEVHKFIRTKLADKDANIANGLRILYGGSVKPDNAAELFANEDVDGGLIGGASLKAQDFLGICNATKNQDLG